MDRDSWLQDFDGYCESQWQWQQQLEKEEYDADHAVDNYFLEKHK